jgi:sigma-E factor negative regulatory protein RseC
MGLKAVLLSYVAPLIVLLAGFFVSQALGAGELAAGLIGLGATALYYFLLWLCRGKVRKEYNSCFKEQLT